MSFRVVVTRTAARQLAEHLPEAVAAACVEFMFGPLAAYPGRVGAPLRTPFAGQWRARRGEYLRGDPYLSAAFEVPESGDDVKAVVDGVSSAAALSQDLPVLDPGDDVFDAGADAPVSAVVVVVDDPAAGSAPGAGDGGGSAVAAVCEDGRGTVDEPSDGPARHDYVVSVSGPALANGYDVAGVGVDEDLRR